LCRVRARIPGHGGSEPGDRVGTTLVDTPYGARSEEMARQARPAVLGGTPKDPLPELPIGRCLVPRAEDGIPTEFPLGMDGRRIFVLVVRFEDRRCPGCTGQGPQRPGRARSRRRIPMAPAAAPAPSTDAATEAATGVR